MKSISSILVLVFLLSACTKKQDTGSTTEIKTFPLRGQVVRIMPDEHRIMIAHQEIPNYMRAMTMPFKVKDTTLLAKVQPGDSVLATLAVSRVESWLETISVIGREAEPTVLTGNQIILKKLVREGQPIPDANFTNQNGKKVHLADYRGKVLALTFIYTRCPLPDFCIRMSNNFSAIERSLKKDATVNNKWHLFSVTFDPDFDKPNILKGYGKTYGADFSDWDFLVTDKASLQKFADGFDLTYQPDEGGLIAHTLRTIVVDQRGNLVRTLKGNDWTPDQIADEIRRLAK